MIIMIIIMIIVIIIKTIKICLSSINRPCCIAPWPESFSDADGRWGSSSSSSWPVALKRFHGSRLRSSTSRWELMRFVWSVDVKTNLVSSKLMGKKSLTHLRSLLVGGLEHFLCFYILGIIIPTDEHIFQRGSNHQPDKLTYDSWWIWFFSNPDHQSWWFITKYN